MDFVSQAMVLPPVIKPELKPKRETRPLEDIDVSFFTQGQTEAFQGLMSFLKQPEGGMYVVAGVAGSGKTTLMNSLIEYALAYGVGRIAMTAPTNQAVKVMRKMAEYKHHNLKYLTCHKMLGLIEHIDTKTGRQDFRPDPSGRVMPTIGEFRVIVVDETSQLNDDLFSYMLPYCQTDDIKFIFVGDPCQTPPVNKVNTIPLDPTAREEYGIEYTELTEIVRQAADNPIIELSTQIRKDIHRAYSVAERNPRLVNGKGYLEFHHLKDRPIIDELLKHFFTSENFKLDDGFVRCVAWRNIVCDGVNAKIRGFLFGHHPEITSVMVGEKLVANSPIMEGKQVIFTTGDTFEVVSFTENTVDVNQDGQVVLKFYDTKVKHEDVEGNEREVIIPVLHADSIEFYNSIVQQLKDYALEQTVAFKRAAAWREYYDFMRNFADVKYNYCCTIHKAQGQTFSYVFVYEGDIEANRHPHKVFEKNRIKYTAVTRPTNITFLVK